MSKLLEIKDFNYYYGNIHAVKGIDIYVNEGEMVTLIGANGAGKTTTLQAISGLIPSKGIRGNVFFDGKEISKLSGHSVTNMGLIQVIEGRHIFAQLTVFENLKIGAYSRKKIKDLNGEIEKIYKLFPRLEERKTQFGGTLSGGEQQMLAIGRAMLGKPKLLLLDEPSLGIAPIVVKEIFEAVKKIRDEGTTILFVEQNSKIALDVADRGYVMQTGEIVIEDTCEKLRNNEEIKKAYLGG